MIVHHINCGCMCPWIAKIVPGSIPKTFCCHCLLIEDNDKLILVDTGISTHDCDQPKRLGLTHKLFNFQLNKHETALHQIRELGYNPDEVTDIILTHLDSDHASGLCDFTKATVHVSKVEMEAARSQKSFHHRIRYRMHYLHDDFHWNLVDLTQGEQWQTFDRVQAFPQVSNLLLVDLPGHTPGHLGVAVKAEDTWLLHAGDAYYHHSLVSEKANAYRLLTFFEKRAHMDYAQAQDSLRRIQDLPSDIETVCSHDASYFPDLEI